MRGTPAAPRSALVVAPNWIGDALMAQPLLALLRQLWPTMRIDVMAPRHVAPVLRFMPEVDSVIATDLAHGKLQLGERLRFAAEVRNEGYDAAWVLPNSLKSALIPWLARIPLRVGYLGEQRFGLLNLRYRNPPKDRRPGMVRHYAQLAFRADAEMPALPRPALQVSREAVSTTAARFDIAPGRPLLAFCPGAEFGPAKRWPAEHFAALAQLVTHAFPYAQIVALGGPKDAPLAARIAELAPGVVNLCGRTTLDEAVALLARTDAAVCNDSGLMHVTAALERPQIAVFGSSDPRHTPPHSDAATIFWLQLECGPCFARECPKGHLRCLREISPEQVFAALREMLQTGTPLQAGVAGLPVFRRSA